LDEVLLAEGPRVEECGPIVLVKRQHFDRPFGIGSMVGWNIYRPGEGIYVYDPRQPERAAEEIFRHDDGVVFDMSLSSDAPRVLFFLATMQREGGGNRRADWLLPYLRDEC
jgi:hypothetical protein